jgi:hypothetical protein
LRGTYPQEILYVDVVRTQPAWTNKPLHELKYDRFALKFWLEAHSAMMRLGDIYAVRARLEEYDRLICAREKAVKP